MKTTHIFSIGLVVMALAACGGAPAPTDAPRPAPTAAPAQPTATAAPLVGTKLVKAVFAKSLDANQAPVNPTEEFQGDQPIALSLQFSGRPKTGKVSAMWLFRGEKIADASVDFADVNSGVIVSIGQDTFAGFKLTPSGRLPVGEGYSVEATLDGQPVGSFKFKVAPPADALPSVIKTAVLAQDTDASYKPINPTSQFKPDQKVVLAGTADFGIYSWVEADWYVNGRLDEAGTRSLSLQENKPGVPFAFSYLPQGGWAEGKHEVALILNGKEAGRYAFTVAK
jgi:hypothetical protein